MSDNAWLTYPPTPADYQAWVAQQEHDRPLPSCLGEGCCPMCGRPVDQCQGGLECEEDDDVSDI